MLHYSQSQRVHSSQSCWFSSHCWVHPSVPLLQKVPQSLTLTPKFWRLSVLNPKALIRSQPAQSPQVLAHGFPQKLQYSHLKSSGSSGSSSCLFHLLTSRAETNVSEKFRKTRQSRRLIRCFILYCLTVTMAPSTIQVIELVLLKPFYTNHLEPILRRLDNANWFVGNCYELLVILEVF